MGIELTKEEFGELKRNLPVDAKGKTDLKSLMDTVQVITGREVHLSDLENAMQNMRIEPMSREQLELNKLLPITGLQIEAHGIDSILGNMVFKLTPEKLNDLTPNLPVDEGAVDINELDTVLQNMGIQLSEMETKDLVEHLPVDGKKVDVNDLQKVLGDKGIQLTEKELVKLKLTLPVDAAGKVYLNRLLEGVKSIKGGTVNVSDIDTVLGNLGIELTENEHESLTENLPLTANAKVDLSALLDAVETITGEEVDVSDVKNVLETMGITLTDKEYTELAKNLPVNASGKIYKNILLNGIMSFKGGKVKQNKVNTVLKNLEIKLSEKELKQPADYIPVNVSGKVNFDELMDGVKIVTGEENTRQIKNILESVGIDLTEKECTELVKNLPVDGNEKVDLDKLMDGVKVLTGRGIDFSDLEKVLGNMGIKLTEKDWLKLLKNLPTDADGKIYQNRLMDGLKSLKEGTIDVSKLDTVLGNMELTEKEFKDLTQNLPVDADGKVTLKTVMDEVKKFSGEKVDVSDLQNLLRNMGIEITDMEYSELKKTLPTDATGQVFQNRVLSGINSLKGGMVNISDLNRVLGNMGIKLTEKELESLVENLPVNANGKIGLSKLIDEVKAVTGENIDISDIEDVVKNMGIELTDEEYWELVEKLLADGDRKTYQNRLLEGIKTLRGGKIEAGKLDIVLKNMGMNFTEKELEDLTKSLPVDANGKVDLNKVMAGVNAVTGVEVDINDVKTVLENIGIELKNKEFMELVKNLPFDGEEIDVNDLENTLKNMQVEFTDEEYSHLVKTLPLNAAGKVYKKRLLDGLKTLKSECKV
uniref:uncharacterized protein LOC120884112 n=1 Tax=Ictidomys tridecemlineatus TaxID=43179 RepID=UPI001A9D405F|nr:uncharacterized protein LOC120884112 [Ictidomys tridecemlineatus]